MTGIVNESEESAPLLDKVENEFAVLISHLPKSIKRMLKKAPARLVAIILINIFVVCNIIMLFVSFGYYRKINFDVNSHLLMMHPVFMVLAFSIAPANGILVYRYKLIKNLPKLAIKLIHAGILIISLLLGIGGLIIVMFRKFHKNDPHFTSLHSWIGALSLVLFFLQCVLGIFVIVPIEYNKIVKKMIKTIHKFTGLILIILPVITILLGLEMSWLSDGYKDDEIFLKCFGIMILVLMLILICFLKGPGSLILR